MVDLKSGPKIRGTPKRAKKTYQDHRKWARGRWTRKKHWSRPLRKTHDSVGGNQKKPTGGNSADQSAVGACGVETLEPNTGHATLKKEGMEVTYTKGKNLRRGHGKQTTRKNDQERHEKGAAAPQKKKMKLRFLRKIADD